MARTDPRRLIQPRQQFMFPRVPQGIRPRPNFSDFHQPRFSHQQNFQPSYQNYQQRSCRGCGGNCASRTSCSSFGPVCKKCGLLHHFESFCQQTRHLSMQNGQPRPQSMRSPAPHATPPRRPVETRTTVNFLSNDGWETPQQIQESIPESYQQNKFSPVEEASPNFDQGQFYEIDQNQASYQ